MKREAVDELTRQLKAAGVLGKHESLVQGCLRMLNAEGYTTSAAARTLKMSRFKLTRLLEAHGYERRVLWLSNA